MSPQIQHNGLMCGLIHFWTIYVLQKLLSDGRFLRDHTTNNPHELNIALK